MKFLNLLLGAAAAGSALAAPACDATAPKDKRASKFKFVGVNQSGAEFGKGMLPGQLGKDYTWPVKSTIDVSRHCRTRNRGMELTRWQTLVGKGMNTFRVPIMMYESSPHDRVSRAGDR